MGRTGTIVSGSFALQVMNRTIYPESDLDLYVFKRDYDEIGRWFLQHSGFPYTFQPLEFQNPDYRNAWFAQKDQSQPEYGISAIAWVANFTCVNEEDGSERKVQIIVANKAPIRCVLEFHSTVVMNVVTHAAAYSFYPKATFEQSRSLIYNATVKKHEIGLAKYAMRGFQMLATAGPGTTGGASSFFPFCDRWADDARSWVVHFNMKRIHKYPLSFTTEPISFDPMAMNGWELQFGIVKPKASITFGVFETALLYFGYVGPQAFIKHMVPFSTTQGKLEYRLRDEHEIGKDNWSWYDWVLPASRDDFLKKKSS